VWLLIRSADPADLREAFRQPRADWLAARQFAPHAAIIGRLSPACGPLSCTV
jgi:hypothetical protein